MLLSQLLIDLSALTQTAAPTQWTLLRSRDKGLLLSAFLLKWN